MSTQLWAYHTSGRPVSISKVYIQDPRRQNIQDDKTKENPMSVRVEGNDLQDVQRQVRQHQPSGRIIINREQSDYGKPGDSFRVKFFTESENFSRTMTGAELLAFIRKDIAENTKQVREWDRQKRAAEKKAAADQRTILQAQIRELEKKLADVE